MLQVIQNLRSGDLKVANIPAPLARPGYVCIGNVCSLISAGTEKMILDVARKSLLGKARERPDQVRQLLQRMRSDGLISTVSAALQKLDEPMPLGYCSAGVVLACGAGVQEFKPGDRVASNGPHAGVVAVPKHLCAAIPNSVGFDQAAFAVLGAIALQGIRLSRLGLGETAFVVGLGLVGQVVVALLKAHGVFVLATDLDAGKCELARRMGADVARPGLSAEGVRQATRGLGADAVLVAASTAANGPIELAADAVRSKGRVVAIGAIGLNLPRRPFYFKEAEFVVSCSYGPGRYDPLYEDGGQDYPAGHVRWTAQRNIQAILDLLSTGRLDLRPLISHRFPIKDAEKAYHLIETGAEPYLGIALEYGETPASPERRVRLTPQAPSGWADGMVGVGCLGAGNFARMVLLPAIKKVPGFHMRTIASAGGMTAAHSGKKWGFEFATTDEAEVFRDPAVRVVFVLTRHNLHAAHVLEALRAGKDVFVEKPLALTVEELQQIEEALAAAGDTPPLLTVGFNRRFSPAAKQVRDFFAGVKQPLTVSIRFNAGPIPTEHWTQDEAVGGGRIIGEACHAIDLATFLTGSPPVRVFAESVGGPGAPAVTDDQCFITLRHANGAISSVAYLAGGDKAFPKERVEVFGGGRVAVIDDFREVHTSVGGKAKRHKGWKQDKGHFSEVEGFLQAIAARGAGPISWAELRAVTLASILAVRSIREGAPFDIPGYCGQQGE